MAGFRLRGSVSPCKQKVKIKASLKSIEQVRKKWTIEKTSCDRIKETTIGGIFMSRSYRHIKEYENEIIELRKQGKTKREICEE